MKNSSEKFRPQSTKNWELIYLFSWSRMASGVCERWAECGVCSDELCDPRVLPCGHTFCMQCALQLKPLLCPLCRTPFFSADSLPKNFVLLKWMDERHNAQLKNESGSESSGANENNNVIVEICVVCQKNPSIVWCELCSGCTSGYFCGECDTAEHISFTTKLHHRMTLEEKAKLVTYPKCDLHHEDKKLYCIEDQSLLCYMCMIDDHKDHNIITIHKHSEDVREELKECLRSLENARSMIEQMNMLELTDHVRVHEMKSKIMQLVEELNKPEALRKMKREKENERQEQEQLERLKLKMDFFKGNANCLITEDGLSLIKLGMGDCNISSTGPLTHWRVKYDGPTRDDPTRGWLLIGVQSDPLKGTIPTFYGLNVTLHGYKETTIYAGGGCEEVEACMVGVGEMICVSVVENQLNVRMENGAWSQTIELPAGRTWYPHFGAFSASFTLSL